MQNPSNLRGQRFEHRVRDILLNLAKDHPTFVSINEQPVIRLYNDQIKQPDFELIYRLDQQHHELIECQSRRRSSSDIANKIRAIKSLSSRNRFVFVFEDIAKLGNEHRKALESDGVNCLSFDEFVQKIKQISLVIQAIKLSPPSLLEMASDTTREKRWDDLFGGTEIAYRKKS